MCEPLSLRPSIVSFFFFQAEDGIRDDLVTGVQTCALPILIRVNQSDLGQGVLTSNPMMICEELECDWSKVQSVYAEPNRHIREHNLYDHLHTEASSSVRLGRALYQQAGASARERLKPAAAAECNLPPPDIQPKTSL